MSNVAIRIENLGKRYRYGGTAPLSSNLRADIGDWLKGMLHRNNKLQPSLHEVHEKHLDESPDYFWALRDINLEIKQGEVVGIIGRNGAGKSTLLKILSRITPPTTGKVTYHGRVASLLEVGTGFHRELTGRENVFLNGSILGMRRSEIAKKFDEIVAFAEVDKFIDTPVKFYSSGMYVRLAFAVAAHLEPELLIVDEVLAVGDAEFQKKCLAKMGEVAKGGRTILFVSHNMGAIDALCGNAALLDRGQLVFAGSAPDTVRTYLSLSSAASQNSLRERADREGTGEAKITQLVFAGTDGQTLGQLISGYDCMLLIKYEALRPLRKPRFRITFYNGVGQPLVHFDSSVVRSPITDLPCQGAVACRFTHFPLSEGSYRANVSIEDYGTLLDHLTGAITFAVSQGTILGGGRNISGIREVCLLPQEWFIVPKDALGSKPSEQSQCALD